MISQRLLLVRKTLKLSQEEFAKKVGMKGSSICDLEHSRCKLTDSNKLLICSTFHINKNWLETGEGEMFVYYNELEEEFFEIFKSLNSTLQSFLLNTAKNLLDIQDEIF